MPLALFNHVCFVALTVPLHVTVFVAVGALNTGAILSVMMRFAYLVTKLPQSSVAVKVYSVVLVLPHWSMAVPAAKVKLTVLSQLSIAVAPPKAAAQLAIKVARLASVHSTIRSCGLVMINGFTLSVIVMMAWSVDVRLQASVIVKVTVTVLLPATQVVGIAV